MFSWKQSQRAALAAALTFMVSPAFAQGRVERTEEPEGDESSTIIERTEVPSGSRTRSERAPVVTQPADRSSGDERRDRPREAERDRAPWAWPWAGATRSPTWTQDWTWAKTHFWVIDVGHVDLNLRYDATITRRKYELDNFGKAQARIGLFPHLELMVSEQITYLRDDKLRHQGNEIGARFSLWDYGTLPLNPTLEAIWKPRHGDGKADQWETRVHLGTELLPGLYVAGNGFFTGETGGSHDYFWGFRWGASYELIRDTLRVGGEGGVSWLFNPDNDSPFRNINPTAGPTVLFRPLGLVDERWGHLLKITASCEFGLRDDKSNLPFAQGSVVIGCYF